MSARYSTSPALHLTVGSSRIRHGLHALLCLCTVLALGLLWHRGYPLLALFLLPPAGSLLCQLSVGAAHRTTIQWRQGLWTIDTGDSPRPVRVLPASVCLPWVICLAWQEVAGGRRGRLWLFTDCVPADQLRRLRVRLTLQR